MRNKVIALFIVILSPAFCFCQKQKPVMQTDIQPNKIWPDDKGVHINAHGGGVMFWKGLYYWHGEYKVPGKGEGSGADGGMNVYTSTDLVNWTNVGLILSVDYKDSTSDMAYGCIFERPKVVYNEKTGKFLAYYKLFPKGEGYTTAYVGVAVANSPLGPFTYSHKFLACNAVNGSGDFAMYKDDDGSLYHLTVQKPVRDIYIVKMSADYMLPDSSYTMLKDIEISTEAPAIIRRNGTYHLFGSASAGWAPTAPRYYTSKNLMGPWQVETNPLTGYNPIEKMGPEKTYGGQSTYIFPVEGQKDAYIMMMDVWTPNKPSDAKYIWLPMTFKNDKMQMAWADKWNPRVKK